MLVRPRLGYSSHKVVEVEVDPADNVGTLKEVLNEIQEEEKEILIHVDVFTEMQGKGEQEGQDA